MNNYSFSLNIDRTDVAIGCVVVEGIEVHKTPSSLHKELNQWIAHRKRSSLNEKEEKFRRASRDILRNNTYKPTGRGKPASEYLLRELDEFPRINGPVDANNLISIKYCVPASLWDLGLVTNTKFEFRLGYQDENYIFNAADQTLVLKDLLCGCVRHRETNKLSQPIVTPVKDSLYTKIRNETSKLAACIYYPLLADSFEHLDSISKEFHEILRQFGSKTSGAFGILYPPEQLHLTLSIC